MVVADLSEKNVNEMYDRGFLFTRLGKGVMQQTRSARIDLSRFSLTSENRRILKKTTDIDGPKSIELPFKDYDFKIGKLAKDFYDSKSGVGTMSAQKIKEMLTDESQSNFNVLLKYSIQCDRNTRFGFAICRRTSSFLHYSYPFYDLDIASKDTGLGMMIRAIEHAKSKELKYVYLGSLQRKSDTYKLQFEGLEWFDGEKWQTDLEIAKQALQNLTNTIQV